METVLPVKQAIEESDWDDLIEDLSRNRCVLFLGRSLPLYTLGEEKIDFYSLASYHLAKLIEGKIEFDQSQSDNLYYIAHKFLVLKKNPIRLQDEIAKVYQSQVKQLKNESKEHIPALYKTMLSLPWNTIVNMQPDNFFESVLKPNEVFAYYDYKPKSQETDIKVETGQFLVYNLFGAARKDGENYNVSSLILTEEDNLEFIRNLVSGKPSVSKDVISRFDNDKTLIFLDCNFENWDFRLLMEMLKMHKESHTYSLKRKSFSNPVQEFYKNRYGFIFVENNSEEFIEKLCEKYMEVHPPPPLPALKKLVICYDDTDEELMRSLLHQFRPWVERKSLSIWVKDNVLPGENLQQEEEARLKEADSILLLISAQFLNEPAYSLYVKPLLDGTESKFNTQKQVFAIVKSACPWQETPISTLSAKYILPGNRIPIRLQQQDDPDKILYEIASAITKVLWE